MGKVVVKSQSLLLDLKAVMFCSPATGATAPFHSHWLLQVPLLFSRKRLEAQCEPGLHYTLGRQSLPVFSFSTCRTQRKVALILYGFSEDQTIRKLVDPRDL